MTRTAIPSVVLLTLLAACGHFKAKSDVLPKAVKAYNTFLRWKKYDSATLFRLPEDRAEFAARYLTAEDDLYVDSIEVRSLTVLEVEEDEPAAAAVVVVAQAYLLPSTVLEKVIMTQRWEYRDGDWLLVSSDKELVPPLDDAEPAAIDEPPAGELDGPADGGGEPPATLLPDEG